MNPHLFGRGDGDHSTVPQQPRLPLGCIVVVWARNAFLNLPSKSCGKALLEHVLHEMTSLVAPFLKTGNRPGLQKWRLVVVAEPATNRTLAIRPSDSSPP